MIRNGFVALSVRRRLRFDLVKGQSLIIVAQGAVVQLPSGQELPLVLQGVHELRLILERGLIFERRA